MTIVGLTNGKTEDKMVMEEENIRDSSSTPIPNKED